MEQIIVTKENIRDLVVIIGGLMSEVVTERIDPATTKEARDSMINIMAMSTAMVASTLTRYGITILADGMASLKVDLDEAIDQIDKEIKTKCN